MIFGDISQNYMTNSHGYFDFLHYNNANFLALNIGGIKCDWSNIFFEIGEKYTGLWIYIKGEPIIKNAEIAKSWSDLMEYFNKDQIDFIYKSLKSFPQLDPMFTQYGI